MKRILLIYLFAMFGSWALNATENITIDCGDGKIVEVCTVSVEYFDGDLKEYEDYVKYLREIYCQ